MRADQRKYHYIYKITRTDGKFYVGMHSTDDLEDRYFGSGQLLWKSIKKHGKEKHSKEILEFLSSRKELKDRERELVNEELLKDPRCLNLRAGGEGGAQTDLSVLKAISDKAKLRTGNLNSFFGKTHSRETKAKIAATRTGVPTPDYVKEKLRLASRKSASRTYEVIDPTGKETIVTGLKQFCMEHGLVYTTLHSSIKLGRPVGNGWQIRKTEAAQP